MKIPKGGVAFFDSGIGGLTVLAECEKRIKGEYFYYYGDNGHAPYGNLSTDVIKRCVFNAFDQFETLEVKAAVVACNTATAVCVEDLRERYSFPIIGTEPAILTAAKKGGNVLVLTTRATFESNRFRCLLQRAKETCPQATFRPVACPSLAGMIERHLTDVGFDFTALLPKEKADAVVLGCTHYIYIVGIVRDFYGCDVYDGNEGIANRLKCVLTKKIGEKSLGSMLSREGQPQVDFFRKKRPFATTSNPGTDLVNFNSKFALEKGENSSLNGEIQKTFFLGKYKDFNQKIHEQMFSFY